MEIIFQGGDDIFVVKIADDSFALVNLLTQKATASVYVDTFLKWGYFEEYTNVPETEQLIAQFTPFIETALQDPIYLREMHEMNESAGKIFGNPHLRG